MKNLIAALLLAGASAFAQTSTTTTTTTTMTGTGTVTEFTPGSAMVIREESGPVSYRYSDTVTYSTKKGRTLTAEEARTRIRVGAPVSVGYTTVGDDRVISRVEIDEDGEVEVERD
ncbi:MAG: hypothetical protein SFU53_04775 [Terrimicrobiaceae bacterium]|nr:hypothetical protein [Terrimicrobiaceae bacterium]